MSPPSLQLQAGNGFPPAQPSASLLAQNVLQRQEDPEERANFDPDASAESIYNLLLAIHNDTNRQEYALNGLVVNMSREQAESLVQTYNTRYSRDLVQDVYFILNQYPGRYVGGLLAPLTWIMTTSDSQPQAGMDGTRARGEGAPDLLPGSDPFFSENSIYLDGPVGKYGVVGSPVKIRHRDARSQNGRRQTTSIERAIVVLNKNEDREEMRVHSDDTGEYVEFTPPIAGKYQYQVYIRHQGAQIQVLEGLLEVKTASDIGQEAMGTEAAAAVGNTPIELYRARLEMQRLAMESEGQDTEGLETYAEQVDEQLENIGEGSEVPIQAVYTQEENGGSQVLSLYAGRDPENGGRFKIIDLTPGVSRREYGGRSFDAALDDFDSANTYPNGVITLRVNDNDRGIPEVSRQIETDGASFWQRFSSGAGWASLGLGALGVASLFIPGAQVAAPYLFLAASATGAVSASASLADRFREAEVSKSGVALDVLGLAGSIIGGAAAFRALSQGGRVLTLASGGRYLLYTEFAVEGGSAVIMSYEGVQAINQVLESDLPRGEKIAQITRTLSGMAVSTGLLVLSASDLQASKTSLGRYFGAEAVDALDDNTLMALSLMDDAQLQTLSRVPRSELSDYSNLIASDWQKARQLLALGEFDNFSAFQRAWNGLDTAGMHRLNQVFDPDYLATLSESMRDRYQRLSRDILVGGVSTRDLNERLAVLADVSNFRNAVREAAEATSRTQTRKISIGQRNVAFGEFNLNTPTGATVSGRVAGTSGNGVTNRISGLAEGQDGIQTALRGRQLVPEIDDARRVFRITDDQRAHDSEAKIMEYIVSQVNRQTGLNLQVGNTYPGFSGRISIFTEMNPCSSCANILEVQAKALFGNNVDINFVYGVEFP